MGLTAALDLDGVLAGARKGAGVLAAHDLGAGRLQDLEIPGRGLGRIDQHRQDQHGQARRNGEQEGEGPKDQAAEKVHAGQPLHRVYPPVARKPARSAQDQTGFPKRRGASADGAADA